MPEPSRTAPARRPRRSSAEVRELILGAAAELARALGPEIRVNGVGPGMIESDWLKDGYGAQAYEAMGKMYRATSALNATISPADVAQTIYALCTAFPKTTGETVLVDAGFRIQKA